MFSSWLATEENGETAIWNRNFSTRVPGHSQQLQRETRRSRTGSRPRGIQILSIIFNNESQHESYGIFRLILKPNGGPSTVRYAMNVEKVPINTEKL